MNIYCSRCKQELEIEKDMGTEIHVFGHECNPLKEEGDLQETEIITETQTEQGV